MVWNRDCGAARSPFRIVDCLVVEPARRAQPLPKRPPLIRVRIETNLPRFSCDTVGVRPEHGEDCEKVGGELVLGAERDLVENRDEPAAALNETLDEFHPKTSESVAAGSHDFNVFAAASAFQYDIESAPLVVESDFQCRKRFRRLGIALA